jgi:hypothetical protein
MAITVDSGQWTGQPEGTLPGVPVVWGEFADEAARDAAALRLREAGARDAASSPAAPRQRAANAGQVDVPDEHPREADIRNQRQLHVGTTMAATSMAAAGLVIATGGAALPAIAAAAVAGAVTAAVGEPIADSLASQATGKHEDGPAPPSRLEGPVLGLLAPDAQTRARAETLLREAGAQRILVQETPAG